MSAIIAEIPLGGRDILRIEVEDQLNPKVELRIWYHAKVGGELKPTTHSIAFSPRLANAVVAALRKIGGRHA